MRTHFSASPVARCYVDECAVGLFLIHPLVGSRLFEATEVPDVRSQLDIVEQCFINIKRYARAPAVPAHLHLRMLPVQKLGHGLNVFRLGVASHEADAGDVFLVFVDEAVEAAGGERLADVLPKILAVAAGTMAGTPGDVDGKCHLVGNFLEDDTRIDVFEHISCRLVQLQKPTFLQ